MFLDKVIEGDIIVSTVRQTFRNARKFDKKWPANVLYYQFDQSVSSNDRNYITESLELLQEQLGQCIQFVLRDFGNLVLVKSVDGKGCGSWVGYQKGIQPLYLQRYGCMTTGTIQHEFLHAL